MRNLKLFLLFGLALATSYSCSKETVTSVTQPLLKHYVITAVNGLDTRVFWTDGTTAVTTTWNEGDNIIVYNSDFSMATSGDEAYTMTCTKVDGNMGTFEGDLPTSLKNGDKLYLIYSSYDEYSQNKNNRMQYCYNSDGNLDHLINTSGVMLTGETTVGNTSPVVFTPRFSMLKLTFTFPESVAEGTTVTNLGVTASSGLYNSYCSDATNSYQKVGQYCTQANSIMTIGNTWTVENHQVGPIYLIVFPGQVVNMYGTANIDGVVYKTSSVITKSATTTIASGKVYSKTISGFVVDPSYSKFAGSGTDADPYKIANLANLKYLSYMVNSGQCKECYFKQTADIALDGSPWIPIGGSYEEEFTGTYDGNGHKITGVLNLSDATYDVGALFGYVGHNTTIKDVHFAGTIDCSNLPTSTTTVSSVVGIPGEYSITIENCSNTANITLPASNKVQFLGGVAGGGLASITGFKLIACTNSGNITNPTTSLPDFYAGGILGSFCYFMDSGTSPTSSIIVGCVNTGNVKGVDYAGGLIGGALADVSGTVRASDQNICSCWSTATSVTNTSNDTNLIASFIGRNNWKVNNCYYKAISGLNALGSESTIAMDAATCGEITGTAPTSTQISAMNSAWSSLDPTSYAEYGLDTSTGKPYKK